MPTGEARANFQNKQIVGFQDMGERLLEYLKLSHEDATQARFDLDGAVAAIISGTPTVNDTLEFGTGKATDGIGHIMDFTQLGVSERTVVFPNQTGITYYWAAAYAQEARGVRVSPRTGAPQYVSFVDTIGEASAPNSVVDNGNGTITLTVNSVTEASVDHSGKEVVVWLVVPQSASEVVAIEVATVTFGGGNNQITTVGNLGQTTVSTNPADYVVLARGVSFRVNPFPTGFFAMGTVLGNGPAAVPNALDTSTQRLLKTFQDASQITFTPYKWISSVNIQDAIQELIDDLEEHTTSTAGALRIGINPNDFSDKKTQGNHQTASSTGGIGSISDGTFATTTERQLDRALLEIDRVIRSRYTRLTYGPLQDSDDTALAPSFGARLYQLRPHDVSGYAVSSTSAGADVLGEQGAADHSGADQRLDFNGPSNSTVNAAGRYERCLVSTNDGALGQEIVAEDAVDLRDCGVEQGSLHLQIGGSARWQHMEACYVHEPSALNEQTTIYGLRLQNSASPSSNGTLAVFERNVYQGSQATSRTKADVFFDGAFGVPDRARRPLVFRDCVFMQGRGDLPILDHQSGMQAPVLFDNCVFISTTDQTVPLVVGQHANYRFVNCHFHAENGDCFSLKQCHGGIINSTIKAGDHSNSNPISEPQICAISGPPSGAVDQTPFLISDLEVEIGEACITASGGAAGLNQLLLFGRVGAGDRGRVEIDGLHGFYTTGAASVGVHQSATIFVDAFTSSGQNQKGWNVSNILLDVNGAQIIDDDNFQDGGRGVVSIWGDGNDSVLATQVAVRQLQNNITGTNNKRIIELNNGVTLVGAYVGNFNINLGAPSSSDAAVYLGDHCSASHCHVEIQTSDGPCFDRIYKQDGQDTVIDNCSARIASDSNAYRMLEQMNGIQRAVCTNSRFLLEGGATIFPAVRMDGEYGQFSNNKVIDGQGSSTDAYLIEVVTATGNIVGGNHFRSAAPTTGILNLVLGSDHVVTGNVFQRANGGGTAINDTSTASSIANNVTVDDASV